MSTKPLALAFLLAAGCQSQTPAPTPPPAEPPAAETGNAKAKELRTRAGALLAALPAEPPAGTNELSEARVDLGRTLYFETRLSKNHDISCNSCHKLDAWGVDNLPTSPGHKGQLGGRNSPTVYNASLHVAQFWDGRAKDVEEQAGGPMVNPIEMAMSDGSQVSAILKSIPGYTPLFEAAFPGVADPVSYENAAIAIGAFERTLLTPSAFDRFLAGQDEALTSAQLDGLAAFMDAGCTTCHNGVALGGQGYFKMGLVQPYESKDLGRFDLTQNEADKGVFKVPSLRNIEKTGPYLHDGSVASLDEAVVLMGRHQLGKELDAATVSQITAFLGSLTGDLPTERIQPPTLPESGPSTPKADPS